MDKQFVNGIYVKKFTNQYGDWISLAIKKDNGEYNRYKFFPKKEQKNDKYIEFYGVVDEWKPNKTNDTAIDDVDMDEIPY